MFSIPPNKSCAFIRNHVTVLDYQNADENAILDFLQESYLAFQIMGEDDNVDMNMHWDVFKNAVKESISRYMTTRSKTIRRKNPWITRDIIHIKRKLSRTGKKPQTIGTRATIASLSSHLKVMIKEAKHRFHSRTLHGFLRESRDKFWRYISRRKNKANECSSSLTANEFNDYFRSVFTQDGGTSPLFR